MAPDNSPQKPEPRPSTDAELEAEVARWRVAARRGLEELTAKSQAASARFEREIAELSQAFASSKARLEESRAELAAVRDAGKAEIEAALRQVERRRRQVATLRTKVLNRERRRLELSGSLAWRIAGPLHRLELGVRSALVKAARLRRRMLRR